VALFPVLTAPQTEGRLGRRRPATKIPDEDRLVLSHRRALVERKMNRLEVGEVVIGAVRGIKPYGALLILAV